MILVLKNSKNHLGNLRCGYGMGLDAMATGLNGVKRG